MAALSALSITYDYVIWHSEEHLSVETAEFVFGYLEASYHSSRTTLDRHRWTMAIASLKKLARDEGLPELKVSFSGWLRAMRLNTHT